MKLSDFRFIKNKHLIKFGHFGNKNYLAIHSIIAKHLDLHGKQDGDFVVFDIEYRDNKIFLKDEYIFSSETFTYFIHLLDTIPSPEKVCFKKIFQALYAKYVQCLAEPLNRLKALEDVKTIKEFHTNLEESIRLYSPGFILNIAKLHLNQKEISDKKHLSFLINVADINIYINLYPEKHCIYENNILVFISKKINDIIDESTRLIVGEYNPSFEK